MGEVYRARDSRLGREVAIKVLPAALASDAERLKRFEKEAALGVGLEPSQHRHGPEHGDERGVSWIAMEFVSGETLRALLAAGALPVKKLLAIATQVAGAWRRRTSPKRSTYSGGAWYGVCEASRTSRTDAEDTSHQHPAFEAKTWGILSKKGGGTSPAPRVDVRVRATGVSGRGRVSGLSPSWRPHRRCCPTCSGSNKCYRRPRCRPG
jgi:hypothetical protein